MTVTELYYDLLNQRDTYLAKVLNGETSVEKLESMDMLIDIVEKGLEKEGE